jgi:hypothetical protein
MKHHKYITLVIAAGLIAATAGADVIYTNYGDFSAASVDFLQVQEHTTNPGDTVPKYGAPIVSTLSDTMDFNPVGFSAIASGAGGSDITDGNLVFGVAAHDDAVIEMISFAERGTFNIGGTGTDATYVKVVADFYVEITEVDNVAVSPIGAWASMVFNPNSNSDGMWELATDGAVSGIWTGTVVVDLNDLLGNDGSRATKVNVDLNNVLSAYSEDGTTSLIAKKDFDVGVSVDIIPEPAALGLILLCASGMVFARRRFTT